MKVLIKLSCALSLIFCLSGIANATDRGVNGLIIGGGAGTLMGQAVGRNAESTMIGATVGGIIGAVIGAENSHQQQERIILHKGPHGRHFNHRPRHNSPHVVYNIPQPRDHRYYGNQVIIQEYYGGRKKTHFNNCRNHNRRHHNPQYDSHGRRHQYNNR